MAPTLSVLLPVYNGGRYLRAAIESLLQQTYQDFEIIIVDDGSTDDTLTVIQSIIDPRIVLIRNEKNCGIVATLNKGLARCTGKYIARMDADDIALPNRFWEQVNYLETHPEVDVLDTVQTIIDENSRPLGRTNSTVVLQTDIQKSLPKFNCLGHPSVMVKGDVLRKYAYRNTSYEDYDLWLRLAAMGTIIIKLPMPLLMFREHSASITGTDSAMLRHFLKIIQTKRFYLSGLTFTDSLRPFNVAVRFWLLRDILIHAFKKMKSLSN
jgi:glycosyltransferase involved in cell wall biosynthesis